ncbi:MAG TPA: DUF29 domain-containing protein [Stellaceae bacterium]|nr:DUF29 domain-containing protein [Stellaceae bacterium]
MGEAKSLYDKDFLLWSKEQAEALRAAAKGGSNRALDWEHIAEQIEDLGKSNRRELYSRLLVVLEHLLKLQYSPAANPRGGRKATIVRERASIEALLDDSPSLRGELAELVDKARPQAARSVAYSLSRRREAAARLAPPDYSVEQILGDWFPDR